jgi:hypothetical protein
MSTSCEFLAEPRGIHTSARATESDLDRHLYRFLLGSRGLNELEAQWRDLRYLLDDHALPRETREVLTVRATQWEEAIYFWRDFFTQCRARGRTAAQAHAPGEVVMRIEAAGLADPPASLSI